MQNTLNRKYLMQAIDGSLERFGLDFVDLLYCHRADPNTPIEETVWAMSDIVSSGKALYWGTSEWSADEIRGAIEIAERHHLHKPVIEQPQYNLLEREQGRGRVRPTVRRHRLGTTIWSPLASGLLTGKYQRRHPRGLARRARRATTGSAERSPTRRRSAKVERLRPIADELGCTLAQLALGVVRDEPERVDRDHRRQPSRARSSRTSPRST